MLWLSLGENCLPDGILKRHGKKSFSTVFSSARSNIDYALALEEHGYENLLDQKNLKYDLAWGTPVVRSTSISKSDLFFNPAHMLGFEFTHHDVLNNCDDINSYKRKIERQTAIKGKDDVIFLYHHRLVSKEHLPKIIKKLQKLAGFYTSENSKCKIALFYQTPCKKDSDRKLEIKDTETNVTEYIFHTKKTWSGNDQNVFWARVDDDLIQQMIFDIEKKF